MAAPGVAGGHTCPERRADPGGGLRSRQDPRGDPGRHRTRCAGLCPAGACGPRGWLGCWQVPTWGVCSGREQHWVAGSLSCPRNSKRGQTPTRVLSALRVTRTLWAGSCALWAGVTVPSGRGHACPVGIHAPKSSGLSGGGEAAAPSPAWGGGRLLVVSLTGFCALQAGVLGSGSKPGSREVLGSEVLGWGGPPGLGKLGRAGVDRVACPAWGHSSCAPICDPQASPRQRPRLCSRGELQGRDTPALAQVRTTKSEDVGTPHSRCDLLSCWTAHTDARAAQSP